MRLKFEFLLSSAMCRVAAAGLLASALGACSTDVARFSDNPFSNPFKAGAATSVDRNATGSIGRQAAQAQAAASAAPAVGRVTSQPLAAPVAASAADSRVASPVSNTMPSRSSLTPRAPSAVDLASTGSVTPRSVAGWSSAGGTPVVMASGENVNTLATRYGVPASAILATNGLSSASQLTPGSRVTIPVYSAGGATAPRAEAPVQAVAPSTPDPVAPLAAATPRPPQPVAGMSQRSEPVRPPAPAPRPVIAAVPPSRENEPARIIPPAQVAAPKAVASASVDAAREKARAQAEAAKVRAEAARQQTAASRSADAEVTARKAAEAKAKAESERARLAELRAKTAEDRVKAAEASKEAESNRIKAAEAKKKAEAAREVQADAKAKADRELKAARADAQSAERKVKAQETRQAAPQPAPQTRQQAAAAAAAAQRQPVDPAPTASVPKDEPKAVSADFRWPARGRVISGFSGKGANEGINIAVPEGTPVKAAGDGVVAYSGNELKGYGNLVLIRHENGYVSAYAHNGDIAVKRGERVSRGQTIAKSGQSGNVASPQLHFEIRKGSTPVDPMPYLAN